MGVMAKTNPTVRTELCWEKFRVMPVVLVYTNGRTVQDNMFTEISKIVYWFYRTIFLQVVHLMGTQQDILNTMGYMYAAVLFLGVQNSVSVQPVVAIERTVFYREKAARMYSALPYAFAQWTVSKFLWYLFMYFTLLYFTFCGLMAVAVTPNHNIAAIVSSGFYALWNLFSGFSFLMVLLPSHGAFDMRTRLINPRIPVWWRWYYYASPVSWSLYGLVASQFADIQDKIDTGETVEH
ncbi:pleiotropic drug resistance protein 1-like [Rhododendron vialii]|uniref:pleiotropic drug resistance protein 1-like n=1 Tax=Rhododendron vialii TaxID=182163 RepID=UPI00265EE4AC|nr:pleiotropic drug resistance protein 1-like [Rhododendron vialii]